MMSMKNLSVLGVLVLSCAMAASKCQGAVIISFVETGGDVVATGSGTLNTTGLTKITGGASAIVSGYDEFDAIVGSTAFEPIDGYGIYSGPLWIGPGIGQGGPLAALRQVGEFGFR